MIGKWLESFQIRLAGFGVPTDSSSLKGRIVRNASWVSLSYGAEIILRFTSSIIVTRLLDPSAFGLISTVAVFMTVVFMLSDLGLRPIVLTHERGDDPDFLASIWVLQIIRGIFLTSLLLLLAWGWWEAQQSGAIAPDNSYANPMLPGLLALVGLTLTASGFNSINEFRLARHLHQGPITRLDISWKTLTTILNVTFAWWLRSAWALAVTMVMGSIFRAVASLATLPGPKMKFRANWSDLKQILGHSRWIALTSTMSVLVTSSDKILIGWEFGLSVLGIYAVSWTLFDAVQNLVMRFNQSMSVSVIKTLKERSPEQFKTLYYRFRLPVEIYCVTFGVTFAFLGKLIIELMYDPRYLAGGQYLSIFGIGLVLFPFAISSNILIASQRFKYVAVVTFVRTICFYAAMGTGAYLHNLTIMVFAITLQRLPEYIFNFLAPHSRIPFTIKRDGLLIAIALALTLWVLMTLSPTV